MIWILQASVPVLELLVGWNVENSHHVQILMPAMGVVGVAASSTSDQGGYHVLCDKDHKISKVNLDLLSSKNEPNTGIPRLVRFFGPQQTALLEKPH